MKQIFFLTLICAFNTVGKAQNVPFKIGFFINPTYSDRFNVQADLQRDLFIGKYAYSIGIFAQKRLTQYLDLRFGASFANNGEQTKRQSTWGIQNSNGGFESFTDDKFELVNNYYNVELPIDIQWFLSKKHSFFAVFGVSPSYNLSNSGTLNFYTNDKLVRSNTSKHVGDNGVGLALQFGMGYQKSLNDNLLFEIQPRFRYYITNINNSRYMYNAGLQINMIF